MTETVSATEASPVRLSVNTASAPSVTGEDTAAIDTPAGAGVTAAVGALVSVSSVPPSSVNVTRTASVLPTSVAAIV